MRRNLFLSLAAMTVLAAIAAILLLTPATAAAADSARTKSLDAFARCLAEKKATMYGAFWCTHCKEQKDLFGSSFQHVPYVECAVTGAPRMQTPACAMQGVRRYPTWIFADGERRDKVQPLADLSKKTGCRLP